MRGIDMVRRRILFIDAYDSFSNSIVSLLTTVLHADVDVLPIDPPHLDPRNSDFREALHEELWQYDAVVCGPGPGSPDRDQDVGIMKHMWELADAALVPVLGICLGFQSLAVSCGGVVKRLRTGLHGMVRDIDHANDELSLQEGNIFCRVPPFRATLYHSLHADIGQQSITAHDWPRSRWLVPAHLPDVVPLAWSYEKHEDAATERILMAFKHARKPFWGLQYHPESICTEATGHQVIRNWFLEAARWNDSVGRVIERGPGSGAATKTRRLGSNRPDAGGVPLPCPWVGGDGGPLASFALGAEYHARALDLPPHVETPDVVEALRNNDGTDDDDACEQIVLDSASANARMRRKNDNIGAEVRGRYSIVALDVDGALKLEYRAGERHVVARRGRGRGRGRGADAAEAAAETETVRLGPGQTVWQLLSQFLARRRIALSSSSSNRRGEEDGAATAAREEEPSSSPFIGGFMGYTTYELGLEGIGVEPHADRPPGRPDLCFAWVTRSVVLDHREGVVRVQCLSPDPAEARAWLDSVCRKLRASAVWSRPPDDGLPLQQEKQGQLSSAAQLTTLPRTLTSRTTTVPATKSKSKSKKSRATILVPDADEYERKVRRCQEAIAAGDSYELCLTDETRVTLTRPSSSSSSSSWSLYRRLRSRQPAPFASYLRLGGATLLGSSPERFLAFDGGGGGRCVMAPMKGTLRKADSSDSHSHSRDGDSGKGGGPGPGAGPGAAFARTREEAQARLAGDPKEAAENLMIVDLVRHDLHGALGPGAARVPHLFRVDEYAGVYQMVSVVEADLPDADADAAVPSPAAAATTITTNGSPLPPTPSSSPSTPGSSADTPTITTTTTTTTSTTEKTTTAPAAPAPTVTGLDVLAAALPPGSMTGAPKRRSCELLLRGVSSGSDSDSGKGGGGGDGGGGFGVGGPLERRARGLYSGVVGYADAAGRGDWSVTIRSLVRWDDETVTVPVPVPVPLVTVTDTAAGAGAGAADVQEEEEEKKKMMIEETWRVGAGGAVTALSTPWGEREEMFTKLRGPLSIFDDGEV
ncbi:ADC synthase [Xylariaceae sp. FL0804]|nr:ADC synthase [Xylariaceae sp. FL0804]